MTDDAYRQLMKHAHRLAMDGHGELAQFLRDAVNEATRHRRCPKCGGADVSAATVCHNSKCSEYANELTFYEGWKAPNVGANLRAEGPSS